MGIAYIKILAINLRKYALYTPSQTAIWGVIKNHLAATTGHGGEPGYLGQTREYGLAVLGFLRYVLSPQN